MGLDNEKLDRALADMAPGYGEVLLALRDELRREGRVGALFCHGLDGCRRSRPLLRPRLDPGRARVRRRALLGGWSTCLSGSHRL